VRSAVAGAHKAWREAAVRLIAAEKRIEETAREEEFLRHAADELGKLNPVPGEEEALAAERLRLQAGERRAEAIAAALAELRPKDRRQGGPGAALRGTARALARVTVPAGQVNPAGPALAAIERAEVALSEAEDFLERMAAAEEDDPRALEAAEERLFALRAAARKHGVQVSGLAAFHAELRARLAALESGVADIAALSKEVFRLRADYVAKAAALSTLREAAARALESAIASELPPLKLERARFVVERAMLPEASWGARGADSIRFLIATNPGEAPGALDKIASGGELSRLMLAMKVVLTSGGGVETLIFDEVDSGIGGATAAAVGERLARVAQGLQVLVVTHSPQVAARGAAQLRVAKRVVGERAVTEVDVLDGPARREEIARMLAGEVVTDAARQAAASLLAG
jgi:DNA repair protein RecN (Recombination protein N)